MCGQPWREPHLPHVVEEAPQQRLLIGLIEDVEGPLKLWLRRVLKVRYVLTHDLPVHNEVALPIKHVGDHEDLRDTRKGGCQPERLHGCGSVQLVQLGQSAKRSL